jgi:2-methylcitrate dehydratase
MDKLPRSGMSEITTKDGKRYTSRIDYPKGDPKNSMSDRELEDKFKSMASKFMSVKQMQKVIETIYQLEGLDNVGNLMTHLIFEGKG